MDVGMIDDDGRYRKVQSRLAVLLVSIVAFGVVDIILDAPEGFSWHVAVEIAFISLSLGTAIFLWRNWLSARRTLAEIDRALRGRQTERDAWRSRTEALLAGLGQAIDEQLKDWALTPSERETALLLLKGLSHREIADLTDRSDRTVRQHAVAVYRKSELRGRAELSAFFLEDLLLPIDPGTGDPGSTAIRYAR